MIRRSARNQLIQEHAKAPHVGLEAAQSACHGFGRRPFDRHNTVVGPTERGDDRDEDNVREVGVESDEERE